MEANQTLTLLYPNGTHMLTNVDQLMLFTFLGEAIELGECTKAYVSHKSHQQD